MINLFEINKDSIIKEGNPILRQVSKDVKFPLSDGNKNLMFRMVKYLLDSNDEDVAFEKNLEPAIGIAAIQIGTSLNMFVMVDLETETIIPVINPKILKKSDDLAYLEAGEGCLSVPDKKDGYVYRSRKIEVEFYNELGEKVNKVYEGMQAVVFQHEYDHLIGKIYTDHIDKSDPFFEKEGAEKI